MVADDLRLSSGSAVSNVSLSPTYLLPSLYFMIGATLTELLLLFVIIRKKRLSWSGG